MTTVQARLRRRIAAAGAITVADYMTEVLAGSADSYYRDRDPLGAAGDFVTAPEISQMFGELIGLWLVAAWRQAGAPAPFRLVELGPGRGTLMADALRAANIAPEFLDAADLHLVEINEALKARQAETLDSYDPAWHDDLASVPGGPLFLVANEFFDALPVRQFAKTPDGWRERLIDFDAQADALAWRLANAPSGLDDLLPPAERFSDGDVREVSPPSRAVAAGVARRIAEHGGAALIVDYGYADDRAAGDTFQALRRHEVHDPLTQPGTADLTAHVDFRALARAAGDHARVWGPLAQGTFLERLGIAQRAAALTANANTDQANDLDAARRRLCDPAEMGTLFKVLAVTSGAAPPPAFEEQP